MPTLRVHLKFDEYLKDHGIISDYTFAKSVHRRMDRGIKVFGPDHRFIDFFSFRRGNKKLAKRNVASCLPRNFNRLSQGGFRSFGTRRHGISI